MAHNAYEFDRPIGQLQPMFKIKTAPFGRRAIDHLTDTQSIFRVSALCDQIQRERGLRLPSKYAEGFLGPVDFSAQHVPAETASETQPLRLQEVGLAEAQRVLGPLALRSFSIFTQRAVDRRNKPRQPRLQNI